PPWARLRARQRRWRGEWSCELPMLSASRRGHNVWMDPQGPLLCEDFDCARCGYDLRGLQRSGQCPECGELIARSLDAAGRGELRYLNRRWLKRIRWAPLLLLLGFVLW